MIVDWVKGVIYTLDISSVDGAVAVPGFKVWSIAGQKQIGKLPAPPEFAASLSNLTAIAVSPGGCLYVQDGTILYRFDPDAGMVTGKFGQDQGISFASLVETETAFTGAKQLLVAPITGGGEYVISMARIAAQIGIAWCESEIQYEWGAYPGNRLIQNAPPVVYEWSMLGASGPFYFNDLFAADAYAVLGTVNATTTEVWIINTTSPTWSFWDGTMKLYLVTLFGASSVQVEFVTSLPAWQGFGGFAYDHADDSLIFAGVNEDATSGTFKWNRDAGIVWTLPYAVGGLDPQAYINGTLGWSTPGWWTVIDTRSAKVLFSGFRTDGIPANAYWFDPIYNSASNSAVWAGSPPTQAFFGLATANGCALSAILTDICLRCGLAADQINVSELPTQMVDGYLIDSMKTGADAIKDLQQAFFFDVIESDYALKFVPRGGPPITGGVLYQADLSSAGDAESGDFWAHTRSQDQDLPTTVLVNFSDVNNECLPSVAYAKRTNAPVATVKTRQRQTISLPIVMALSDAQLIAQTALWTAWAERDTFSTVLGLDWLFLDPADVVTVSLNNGFAYTVRVSSVELGADYTIRATFTGLDQSTYTG